VGIKIIKSFIIKHKISYAIGITFMLLSSFIQALFPKVLGSTIDILKLKNFNTNLVKINILYMILIAMGTFSFSYVWRNLVIGNSRKLECHLRDKLLDHFQKLSPEFYNSRKTGDLIAYSINDISAVRATFGAASIMTINGITLSIVSIYDMVTVIDLKLTLIALLPIPLIIFIMVWLGKIVQKRFRKVQESFANISDRVQENIYGIRVIKAYAQEDGEVKNFQELNEKMSEANIQMVKVTSVLTPIIDVCFSFSFIANLIIGGNMVLNGTISLGEFIAFNTYLTMILRPIISIGRVINIFQRGMASLKRLDGIFSISPVVEDAKVMIETAIHGDILFNDLTYSYPGSNKEVLKNIDLEIYAGHTLGIIGMTGSGKSSIANLILRLYNVPRDKVLLDGKDINDYALSSIRQAIGYVPQDMFLFSASIKDNITFLNENYTTAQIEMATKNSCIFDSIMEFPDKFDTILGERGVNLSGGQKQRVSIARAIIKDPVILILDDAFSALDSVTETQIIKNLKEIRKNKTTIIISHRISSVEDADQIIVMSDGNIMEAGTHEELLVLGGMYHAIYSQQYYEKVNTIGAQS
jgi:ATP-binding cassette, subfamily B, multidrug efflux pump